MALLSRLPIISPDGGGNFKQPQWVANKVQSTELFGWPRRDRRVARLSTLSTIERRFAARCRQHSARQPYRQRGQAARHWTDMKSKTQYEHKKTQRVAASASRPLPPKSSPNWKPEPCGLSREELRKIVTRIMG